MNLERRLAALEGRHKPKLVRLEADRRTAALDAIAEALQAQFRNPGPQRVREGNAVPVVYTEESFSGDRDRQAFLERIANGQPLASDRSLADHLAGLLKIAQPERSLADLARFMLILDAEV